MKPDIWGKYLWISIHFIAMEYPHEPSLKDKQNYRIFFDNLKNVIPCKNCSDNYKDHLIKYPLTDHVLSSRMNLFKWTVDIHNEVNKITNVPQISYESAISIYTESLVNRNDKIQNIINNHSIGETTMKTSDKFNYIINYNIFRYTVLLLVIVIIASCILKKRK